MYQRVTNSYIRMKAGDSMLRKMANHILSNTGATMPGDFAKLAKQQGADQSTMSKIFKGSLAGNADNVDETLHTMANGSTMQGLGAVAKNTGRLITGKDMAGEGWARAGAVAARNGIPLAAYGVAANIPRYMSGGSATTNNQGQRDIAGIPFL